MGVCESSSKSKKGKIYKIRKEKQMSNSINDSNQICKEKLSHNRSLSTAVSESYISELTLKKNIYNYYSISEENNKIGEGATSIVRKGIRISDQKVFSIKSINKSKINYNQNALRDEIRISLLVDHENLIKTYEIYEDQNYIHIVQEYIEGGNLLQYILSSKNERLSEIESIIFLNQILSGLSYLHNTLKIVHRDIKPENILIKNEILQNGKIKKILKLIDFGFSCNIPENGLMNQKLGTSLYQSPEMIEGKKYTYKTDLWSTGVLFMNMFTGCEPFSSSPNEPLQAQILTKEIDFDVFRCDTTEQICRMLLNRNDEVRADTLTCLNFTNDDLGFNNNNNCYNINNFLRKIFDVLDESHCGFIQWNDILEEFNYNDILQINNLQMQTMNINNKKGIHFEMFKNIYESGVIF